MCVAVLARTRARVRVCACVCVRLMRGCVRVCTCISAREWVYVFKSVCACVRVRACGCAKKVVGTDACIRTGSGGRACSTESQDGRDPAGEGVGVGGGYHLPAPSGGVGLPGVSSRSSAAARRDALRRPTGTRARTRNASHFYPLRY